MLSSAPKEHIRWPRRLGAPKGHKVKPEHPRSSLLHEAIYTDLLGQPDTSTFACLHDVDMVLILEYTMV